MSFINSKFISFMEENAKFTVVGMVPCIEYQKAKFLAEQLHHYFPNRFQQPEFRPMLDIAWKEFRTKIRRRIGGLTWVSRKQVAVFANGYYIGDDTNFQTLIETKYCINIFKDFEQLGLENLKFFLERQNRPHVFFKIWIKGELCGTLLFQLYMDLVPVVCNNFLRLVKRKTRGYKGTVVNRICKTSWLQIGGDLKSAAIPCENYYVPHDRKGVLSMCHSGKHKNNSTSFFISLNPTPWMDYYYVGFGQLVHGEKVLKTIESVPTIYQSPVVPITIEDCGEYTISDEPPGLLKGTYRKFLQRNVEVLKEQEEAFVDNIKHQEEILRKVELDILQTLQEIQGEEYELEREREKKKMEVVEEEMEELRKKDFIPPIYPPDLIDHRDVPSEFKMKRFRRGLYSL